MRLKQLRLSLEEIEDALSVYHRGEVRQHFKRNGIFREPTALECCVFYAEKVYGVNVSKEDRQGE